MRRLFLTTAALCVLPASAWAQVAQPAGETSLAPDAPNTVSQIVVTANRTEQARDRVPFSVTVLDSPRIRESQAVSAVDLLVQTPGVSFNRNGGPGQTTGLSIRGAETSQTLVVIDGVRVNDPSSPAGGYDFAHLLLGDIERIEVLRGPQSTLWGSQAIGGVVNIVTAAPAPGVHADGALEGGSYGTVNARAGVGGQVGRLSFRLGGGWFDTDGASAFDRRFGGKESDGFRQGQLSGRARLAITDTADLDLRAYFTDNRTQFDGFAPPTYSFGDTREYGAVRQLVDYTGLNLKSFEGRLTSRFAVQYAAIDRANYDPASAPFDLSFKSRGKSQRLEYQGTADLAPGWRAVFGAERERTSFTDLTPFFANANTRPHTAITSGYAQLQADLLPNLTVTAGGRYDSHDIFGNHPTGQLGAAWRLNGGATVLRASYGSGFKAPTLYQLYSDYGNLTLKPEAADGWDAGVEQRLANGRVVLQATYFGRETRNLIDFTFCSNAAGLCTGPAGPRFGYYANVAKTFAQGVELQGQAELLPRLILSGQYSFIDAEDRSPGSFSFGKRLQRRPQHTASTTLSYGWAKGATVAAALRYSGDSFDDRFETRRLKSYALLDVRAAYPLTRNLELYGRIENLTDRAYETVYQYGQPGRAAYAGVRVKF